MIDDVLLDKARQAGAKLEAAEAETEVARGDYHHAIRSLHLGGATLREVASALGISHQRVQQIVKAAGGSWWSRVWRNRGGKDAMQCSFCQRSAAEVASLIAGPQVHVCGRCVAMAEDVLSGGASEEPALAPLTPGSRARCSFCGQRAKAPSRLVAGHAARVCSSCLRQCDRIIQAHRGAKA